MGDCVDCDLCVQVCPVGIDIRDGLQYECINFGLCVDACDQTMDKFDYPQRLISFASEKKPKTGWKRHVIYGGVLTAMVAAIALWAMTWQSVEGNIIRDRQALYRVNDSGKIENTYLLKIRKKTSSGNQYRVSVQGIKGVEVLPAQLVSVKSGELVSTSIPVNSHNKLAAHKLEITFSIDADNKRLVSKNTSFFGGNAGW